ncbi:MAG TPA: hypothetical protein VGD62_06780 [Acidobacteriaceae bacterium]
MKRPGAYIVSLAVPLVLLAGLAGCRHKVPPPPPPPAAAPPLSPNSMTDQKSLPAVPPPTGEKVGAPGSDEKAQQPPPPPPPKHTRRPRKRATTTDTAAASPTAMAAPTAAAAPASPGATAAAPVPDPAAALGQLSAGRNADTKESAQMNEEIRTQDARLSAIKQPASEDSEAILAQIRAFLSKARQAVKENDLDGARTLTTKAKVLLDELSKS